MGMAASQARLLSITTRLSDNELRSQLINNQKMRLATESAKVSERYVAALNDTNYMMNYYDVKGNPINKELTFAALTAYSSYNNQYGLRNLSGQLLVSEETATKYEEAVKAAENNTETTALEEFLKLHNIEKSTTFFDKLTTEQIDKVLGMPAGTSSGLTAEDLKNKYLGYTDDAGNVHPGYEALKGGAEYTTGFEPKFTAFNNAYINFQDEMFKYCDEYNRDTLKLNELKAKVEATGDGDIGKLRNYYGQLAGAINTAGGMGAQGDPFFSDFGTSVTNYRDGISPETTTRTGNTVTVEGVFTFNTVTKGITPLTTDGTLSYLGDDGTNYKINLHVEKDGEKDDVVYYIPMTSGDAYTIEPDNDNYKNNLINLLNTYLEESLYHFDYTKFNVPADSPAGKAKQAYLDAGKALSEYMFGNDVGANNYQQMLDLAFIFDKQDRGQVTTGMTEVLDILILDAIFNAMGDPIMAWVDTTDPNENGEAKAQWYTNLFNRMQSTEVTEKEDGTIVTETKTNYAVLENGLATSAEWIRFALESGLVSMEQVDKNNEWCSTMYSNCSDIREETDKTEATIAEAEYNAAMAKIESKDKQFDMQLKNIDTEHNALQTEYDSIKTVLDKNIERNFKMYSA